MGAGTAWRERGMVRRDRRKMERDMVGETACSKAWRERGGKFLCVWRGRNVREWASSAVIQTLFQII